MPYTTATDINANTYSASRAPYNGAARPMGAAQSWAAKQNDLEQARQTNKLREACRMFEAQFVKMLMGEMRKTVGKDKLMGGGFGEEMFTGPLDEARADIITQGRSIGISEMLEKQLSQNAYQRPVQFRMPSQTAADSYSASGQEAALAGRVYTIRREDSAANKGPAAGESNALVAPANEALASVLKNQEIAQAGHSPLKNRIEEIKQRAAGHNAENVTAMADMSWPLDAQISSNYGKRFHPLLKTNRMHSGIDLMAPTGTPVQAALSGHVVFAGNRGQLGNAVIIEHADGRQTVYGHCSRLLVRTGQNVEQGEVIAKVGSTGLATGPHLHFEVRDENGNSVNPLAALNPRNMPEDGVTTYARANRNKANS